MKLSNLNHEFKMRITLLPYNDEDNEIKSIVINYGNNLKCLEDVDKIIQIYENIAESCASCARFDIYDNLGLNYFSQYYDYGFDTPYYKDYNISQFSDMDKYCEKLSIQEEDYYKGNYHYLCNNFIHNFMNNLI